MASAKDTRLRIRLDRQANMVQTADGSPEEGAGRQDDDMSNPMWAHIIRLLDDEEQAKKVLQIWLCLVIPPVLQQVRRTLVKPSL